MMTAKLSLCPISSSIGAARMVLNILVLELKKTTNRAPCNRDRARVRPLRGQMRYRFGELIECETREGHEPGIVIAEWLGE